jgi:flagellar motor switch protein FliG
MTSPLLRQAALLLSALPKPQLAAILKRLSASHAASLSRELSQLREMDSAEMNVAVRAFLDAYQTAAPASATVTVSEARAVPPPHLDPVAGRTGSSANNHAAPADPATHASKPSSPSLEPPAIADGPPPPSLLVLEELPVPRCLEALDGEDDSLIAAVLFLLTPKKAAAIVEQMSLERRVAVFQWLSSIQEISRETFDHLRRRLERKLEFGAGLHSRPEGLHRARTVLEQLHPAVQRTIADALVVQNPALASELHRHVFRFNDIVRLHRDDVRKLARLVSIEILAAALKYSENRVRDWIVSSLPPATAQSVADQINALESLSIEASGQAQQTVVDTLQELFRRRVIQRPGPSASAPLAAA